MPAVRNTGQRIGDRKRDRLLVKASILHRQGRLVCNRSQHLDLLGGEAVRVWALKVQDAQNLLMMDHRNTEKRTRFAVGAGPCDVDAAVRRHVRDVHRAVRLHRSSARPFIAAEANLLGSLPGRVGGFHLQRPVAIEEHDRELWNRQSLGDVRADSGEQLRKLQCGGERSSDLVEQRELVEPLFEQRVGVLEPLLGGELNVCWKFRCCWDSERSRWTSTSSACNAVILAKSRLKESASFPSSSFRLDPSTRTRKSPSDALFIARASRRSGRITSPSIH